MKLNAKTAIVTGAARGIGREIALLFAAHQARVVVVDVAGEQVQSLADEIRARGGEAHALRVDITDGDDVAHLVDETVERFGTIDILVNNAGVSLNKPFLKTSLEEWQRQVSVNLTGTFRCAQAVASVMVRQGGGRIVNIASISGQRGGQGRAAYGAAKAGVIQLTRVMAVELAAKGVVTNAIAPGPILTPMVREHHTDATRRSYYDRIPMRRYGETREIAAAALFLASADASFVNGITLNVDGGFDAAGLQFDPNEGNAVSINEVSTHKFADNRIAEPNAL